MYELGARLGSGGYADVVAAYPVAKEHGADYQNPLALKLFKEDALHPDVDGFNRENAALLRIGDQPNIIRAVERGVGDIIISNNAAHRVLPGIYILMEYADGGSVASQVPLPVHQSARMGHQVLWALGSIHRWGLVHRDVKPSNILVTGKPEQPTFKLGDLGAADRAYGGTRETLQDKVIGTERYAPGEVYKGKAVAQTDFYGLGLTLAAVVTNQKVRDKEGGILRLEELAEAAGIPRDRSIQELGRIILKATQDNPRNRYTSALEMQAALARVVDETAHGADPRWKYKSLGGRRMGAPGDGTYGTKRHTNSGLWVPSARVTRGLTQMPIVVEEVVDGDVVPMARVAGERSQEPDTQMGVLLEKPNVVVDRVRDALGNVLENMQSWAERRYPQRETVPPVEFDRPSKIWQRYFNNSLPDWAEKRNDIGREKLLPLWNMTGEQKNWQLHLKRKSVSNITGKAKRNALRARQWLEVRRTSKQASDEQRPAADSSWRLNGVDLDNLFVMPLIGDTARQAEGVRYYDSQKRRVRHNGSEKSNNREKIQNEDVSTETSRKLGRRNFLILGALTAAAGGGVLGKEVYERLKASDVSDTVFALEEFIPKDQGDFQISTAQAFMDKYEPFYALRMIEHLEEKGMIDEAAVAAQRFADDDPLSARRTLYNLRDKTNDRHVLSRFDDYRAVLALHNPELVQKLQAKYKPGNHMRQFYQVALMPERSRKNLSILQDYVSGSNYWHPKQLAPVLAARNPELLLGFANDIANSKAVYRGDKGRSDSAFALLNTIAEEFIPNNPVAADKLMRKIENITQQDNDTQYPLRLALRFAAFHPQTAYNALERYRSYGDAWKGSGDILRIALAPHFDGIKSPEGTVGKAWFAYASDPRDKALKAQAMEALRGSKNVATNAHWLGLALLRGQTARYK